MFESTRITYISKSLQFHYQSKVIKIYVTRKVKRHTKLVESVKL